MPWQKSYKLLLSVLSLYRVQPDLRHLDTPSTSPDTLTSPPTCPFCLDRTSVASMLQEHPCRPRNWKGIHSPRSLATGLPCDPLSLLQQDIALRLFLPVSPNRALIDVLPSNSWRALSLCPLPEPTEHLRTYTLATDVAPHPLTLWPSNSSPPCLFPPGRARRTPWPDSERHVICSILAVS
jgi:hypothetical protein